MPTGVNLIEYKLTPLQVSLIEWMKRNPYSRITLTIQDGVPVQAHILTPDGIGERSILFDKVARELRIIK